MNKFKNILRKGLSYGLPAFLYRTKSDPTTYKRILDFYGRWIRPGDLCFDIGAFRGEKTKLFLALGGRVLAVEPQPCCIASLRRRFAAESRVRVIEAALGSAPGRRTLLVRGSSGELASFSAHWQTAIERLMPSGPSTWREIEGVQITTLDALIDTHGLPAFCKIDVEGFEDQVLLGLSQTIPHLCFEALPFMVEVTLAAITRLQNLADYRFNYCFSEAEGLALAQWTEGPNLAAQLVAIAAAGGRACDVHAHLLTSLNNVAEPA